MLKSRFAKAVLAQLPVIGPHADIEAELLLAGIKPIGWVSVYRDDYYPQERDFDFASLDADKKKKLSEGLKKTRHEIDMRRKLDEEVTKGNLKSVDVHYPGRDPNDKGSISRVYCQPEHEQEMRMVAAVSQKFANREPLTPEEDKNLAKKDMGEYLGYRKRDTMLFRLVNDRSISKFVPDVVLDAIYAVNEAVVQPALRDILLDKAEKQCAKKGIVLKPR